MRDNSREEVIRNIQEHEMPGYGFVEKIRALLEVPVSSSDTESTSIPQPIPTGVRDNYNQAQGFEANNQFGKALETLLESINIEPSCARCWSALAPSLYRMGWHKDAELVIKRALELDKNSSKIWGEYGSLLLYLKRIDEAAKALERSVEIDSRDEYTWVNLSSVYLVLQRPNDAVKAWQEVTRINPNHSVAWFNLGSLLYALGKKTESEAAYAKFIELRPEDGPRAVALAKQAAAGRRQGQARREI
ncbi:MAG: tetratricopeptide repeat protein [Candidatus Thorarchaeota archaeon]|nr:tetratricopeptide repeat protein [Candidatus Thorarchaeota archaeon]